MPRMLPAGMVAELKKRNGFALIALLDVQTVDGTNFYWSDVAGNYPVKLGAGPNADYSPWLKSAGPLQRSKDLATDAGDVQIQNLSGNLIDRDVAAALKAHEFEGALAVLRFWHPLLQDVADEQHGTLTEQAGDDEQVQFRLLQVLDPSLFSVPEYDYQVECPWRFKSDLCGSTGSAAACNKSFANCQDASRAAVERYAGILMAPPTSIYIPPVNPVGGP